MHYPICLTTFMQKYSPATSSVYCVLAKFTNSNSRITQLFMLQMATFPKTLLLVSQSRIQYTHDNEGPHYKQKHRLSSLKYNFVETPHKFIIVEVSIHRLGLHQY